ncbi:MAG: hypothetical protein WC744_04455 [Patescibacteria group bacterium]|jgi:hypothetical protein
MLGNEAALKLFSRNLHEESFLGSQNNHKIEIWGSILQNELARLDPEIKLAGKKPKGYLTHKDVSSIVPRIFDDTEACQETFTALDFNKNPAIHNLKTRFVHIESGQKAYIFLTETTDPAADRSIYYITYLSRGPDDSFLGQEAKNDFNNLARLNELAEDKIADPNIKEQFKFIKPLALGKTAPVNGHQYTFFTMPFIEGYGELRLNHRQMNFPLLVEGHRVIPSIPNLSYAGPPTDEYKDKFEAILMDVDFTENAIMKLTQSFGPVMNMKKFAQFSKAVENLPFLKKFKKQLSNVLFGNALIYLLTGGLFPKEFAINAGDWMADLESPLMKLYLISLRGGLEKIRSDEDWVKKMENHIELPDTQGNVGMPFAIFSREEIQTILQNAKSFIK